MHEIKSITNNDQGQLIGEFGFLQEILNSFWIIAIALSTDAFHFFDLSSLAGGLYVFKMHFLVLTKVHDRAEEIEETLVGLETLKEI